MSDQKHANYTEVGDYYDKLWAELDRKKLSGINSRHRFFLRFFKKAGLKKDSRVLEIGCGNGTLTAFIAKQIPGGIITGVDISKETIEMARYKYSKSHKNAEFLVSDMSNFQSNQKYDFVIFPDVLEHIPLEAHHNIFKSIRQNIHQNSTVLINIPYPSAVEYMHKYRPELMQIIDQALHTDKFLAAIYASDFQLESLNSYAVFFDEFDYQFMVFKPKVEVTEMHEKSKLKVIMKSIFLRIENYFT